MLIAPSDVSRAEPEHAARIGRERQREGACGRAPGEDGAGAIVTFDIGLAEQRRRAFGRHRIGRAGALERAQWIGAVL